MDNCLFCKIAAKTIPSAIVYEDNELLAFKDIYPKAPLHLLIIPKLHLTSLAECTVKHTELLGNMMTLASKLAIEFGCGLSTASNGQMQGGFRTQFNTGPDGGQEVYHLHLHVMGGSPPWS